MPYQLFFIVGAIFLVLAFISFFTPFSLKSFKITLIIGFVSLTFTVMLFSKGKLLYLKEKADSSNYKVDTVVALKNHGYKCKITKIYYFIDSGILYDCISYSGVTHKELSADNFMHHSYVKGKSL